MIDDLVYKLARKSLGRGLYAAISGSRFGRTQDWVNPATYADVFGYYRERLGDFAGKTVCELGSGFQFFTAVHFVAAGATRVLLAEPKSGDATPGEARARLERDHGMMVAGGTRVPALDEIASKVTMLPGLEAADAGLDGKVDILCSHLVLEHITDLDSVFRHSARLLAPSGRAFHRVDLSDHTYHFLAKYPAFHGLALRRTLYHLRYSNRMFSLVNDPKCWMGRKVVPEFLRAAERAGLKAELRVAHRVEGVKAHRDVMARFRPEERHLAGVVDFSLEMRRT